MALNLHWLPNAICFARILLVAPIVYLLLQHHYLQALGLILVAGISDGLDGYLAKTFDWRSHLGSLLDPAADKLLLVSVFLALTWLGLVPVALTALVLLRDVVIVTGALIYQHFFGRVEGEPTAISKINTACQLSFVIFTITHAALVWPPQLSLTLLGAAVAFTSINSGLDYVMTWSKRAWLSRRAV